MFLGLTVPPHGAMHVTNAHSRAPFSVSPLTSARLVNCQAGQ